MVLLSGRIDLEMTKIVGLLFRLLLSIYGTKKRDRTIFCYDAVKDYLYSVLNIYSMLWRDETHCIK